MKLFVPLFIGIILCSSGNGEESSMYPYHLSEVSHAVSGVISVDTARGERVRAIVETLISEEHGEKPEHKYLQLTYTDIPRHMASKSTQNFNIVMTTEKPQLSSRQHQTHQTGSAAFTLHSTAGEVKATSDTMAPSPTAIHQEPTTEDMNRQTSSYPHDVTSSLLMSRTVPVVNARRGHGHPIHPIHLIHHGLNGHAVNVHKRDTHSSFVSYNVAETSAFYVDPKDKYIKVNDTLEIEDHESIEFYVYLTNGHGQVVSNPLPFTIHIERPEEDESYPLAPAVFAGVLVLVIVFLALFIPFVTRAKRRYRQGKPVFKLGSSPSTVDFDQASMSRASSEPNWYGNNAYYNYEDEIEKGRNDFSKGIKEYTVVHPTTVQLQKTSKETLSVNSGSSGIDMASQYAEGTIADETMSQRM